MGCSAIGSSEACMLGGMAAKWRWRAKRQAAGKSTDKPNMVCGPVQVVWHKFARYWDIEMREIPMSPGKYCMDVEQMLAQVDENTIMVVPTFGVTYTGSYEPVLELAQALDKLAEDTGLDIDIHVDGASGAFLAPFCAPDVVWDFRIPRVKSISTSGHKFGLAPLGVGWVLWRDKEELPDDLIFHVTYLGGDMPVFQINFSRPAGQIVAQYYNFVRLGMRGYQDVHDSCYATAKFLAEEIVKLGPFELLCDGNPLTGIPSVAWRIREGEDPGYTLYDIADRLRVKGWQVPAYPLTGSVSDISVQRILVRQGVSRDLAFLLLDDIKQSIDHFAKHPVTVAMTKRGVRRLQPSVVRAAGAGCRTAALGARVGLPVDLDRAGQDQARSPHPGRPVGGPLGRRCHGRDRPDRAAPGRNRSGSRRTVSSRLPGPTRTRVRQGPSRAGPAPPGTPCG